MNINHSQISPTEAALLFDEIYLVKEKDFSIQINYTGSNHPKVLHVVYLTDTEFNTDIQFIYTVSEKGLKIEKDNLAIVNVKNQEHLYFQNLNDFFGSTHIIFWGCNNWLNKQGITAQNYSAVLYAGVNCILVEPSKTIENDTKLKALLWGILQKVFFEK
ncbi:MAG: hypothetical protein ACK4K9_06115 [Bacteroidia bacterium]